ncbi:MAG: hypothetical protein OEZ43_08875 [Gammaproteobacteria bacterium]|nr:hypothetical protein [Gammaproteobacteria bacterium]
MTDNTTIETENNADNLIHSRRAKGLAHEINNCFQAIKNNLFLANRYFLRSDTNSAENEIFRAQLKSVQIDELLHKLCNMLSTTSENFQTRKINIIKAIESSLSATICHISEDIEFVTDIDTTDTSILVPIGMIDRLLTIAIGNAVHSIGKLGRIRIRAKLAKVDDRCCCCQQAIIGKWFVIDIEDNSSEQLEESTIPLLFKPYYRETEMGRHTAMFSLEDILHREGGHITLSSVEGCTVLRFYFS